MANDTANKGSEQLRDRIGGWLTGDGWKIKAGTADRATWAIEADDGHGRILQVGQPAARPDRIEVFAGITVSEGHRGKLAAMDATERQELLWRLRYEVARLELGFQGIQEPLEQFGIATSIYRDGLSQDAFCQRIFRVKNCVLLCLWTLSRGLDGSAVGAEAAGDVVH